LMRILFTDPRQTHVPIAQTVAGLLCTLRYPHFQPNWIRPLEFAAIGSGKGSAIEIKKRADWIFAGDPGSDLLERMTLSDVVSQFIAEHEIRDVGGMYPCIKLDHRGVSWLGIRHSYPLYAVSLSFDPQKRRWVQENHTTGKKIELLYPWEIVRAPSSQDQKFDDMRQALENANPLRARRSKSSAPD
jgi:hypothetical protein